MRSMLSRPFLVALLLLGACDLDGGGDPLLGAEGVAPTTASGVTVAAPSIFAEAVGSYRSSPEGSDFDAIDSNTRGYVAVGPCGTAGYVFRALEDAAGSKKYSLRYREVATDGATTETTLVEQSSPLAFEWSLVFDGECRPHVFRVADDHYERWTREAGADAFTTTDVLDDLEMVFGTVTRIDHHAAVRGHDGAVHVFFEIWVDGQSKFLHAIEVPAGWDYETTGFEQADIWEYFGFAVDAEGVPHTAYRFDRHLGYARLEGGSWQHEDVALRADFDDEPALMGSIAVGPGSTAAPHIAATYAHRSLTGSFQRTQLRYSWRDDIGGWHTQILVQDSDRYAGGDGTQFTGWDPHITVDAGGHPHVAFSDLASWHAPLPDSDPPINANDYLGGQIRYIYRDGDAGAAWSLATLFEQLGQTESPNPLHGLSHPTVAVAGDGRTAHVIGMERVIQGPTALYSNEQTTTYRGLYFRATR